MKKRNPGENSGKDGGIYQEIGPRGGKTNNFAAVKDNQKMPPTQKSGNHWELYKRAPNSKR